MNTQEHATIVLKEPPECKLQDVMRQMRTLIGSRCGLIKEVQEVPRAIHQVPIYYYKALLADPRKCGGSMVDLIPVGTSLVPQRAWIAAVGEAIERYSCACYDPHTFELLSYRQARQRGALCLEKLVLYSEAQYQQGRFSTGSCA